MSNFLQNQIENEFEDRFENEFENENEDRFEDRFEDRMNAAVILAAGKGTRMGGDKLFLCANGEPIIAHTWRRWDRSNRIHEIVIVIGKDREKAFHAVAKHIDAATPYRFVIGGTERQESVWNGILATNLSAKWIAIHDGARPCVSDAIIIACLNRANEIGASVAASKVIDTIQSAKKDLTIDRNVDRSRLWAIQTPQVFRREIIIKALDNVRQKNLKVTDDSSACQCIGQAVALVENASPNPKLTLPSDLNWIECLLSRGNP